MTIRECTCGRMVTTRTAKILGRQELLGKKYLVFNCLGCNSTLYLKNKNERASNEQAKITKPVLKTQSDPISG